MHTTACSRWLTLPVAFALALWGLFAGVAPTVVYAQVKVLIEKRCGACGKPVPLSSRVGQHCPHCGAYWAFEKEVIANAQSSSTPSKHVAPVKRKSRRKRCRRITTAKRKVHTNSSREAKSKRITLPQVPCFTAERAKVRNWKEQAIAEASCVNANVRSAVIRDGNRNRHLLAVQSAQQSTRSCKISADVEERVFKVLRISRGYSPKARQVAMHVVRHPNAIAMQISCIRVASPQERTRLLKEAMEIVKKTGLPVSDYRAFKGITESKRESK